MTTEPSPGPDHDHSAASVQRDVDRWQVRRLTFRVLAVQIIALIGLGLLQAWFGRP